MTPKILLLALSLLSGFFLINTSQAEPIVQVQNSNQSVTLDMQNMTCAMCKITIKKALQDVDGVQDVKVDPESKTSTVTFSPQKTNIEALIKATTNAGYPATTRQPK
ncbi:MAG: cation transporter [Methylococcales bacterium]|jgi:mercuric ion binding protein|nr:cation transporter [Methylococcales bacterium]